MTKTEFVALVAENAELPKTTTKAVIDAIEPVLAKVLADGDQVIFGGLKVYTTEVAERECRNPHTGEKMTVPAHTAAKAKVMTALKGAVG